MHTSRIVRRQARALEGQGTIPEHEPESPPSQDMLASSSDTSAGGAGSNVEELGLLFDVLATVEVGSRAFELPKLPERGNDHPTIFP